MTESKDSVYTTRLASEADRDSISRFNQRLANGGVTYRLPLDFTLPGEKEFRRDGHPVFREMMILENGGEVRAGVLLQHGEFYVNNQARSFCWLQLPLSEGLLSRAYAPAFSTMMRQVLLRSPFSASLGIGSKAEPYARFLTGWKWKHQAVPFFFYFAKPARVLLELPQLQKRRVLRIGARLAAYTGLASLLGAGLALFRRLTPAARRYTCTEVPRFESWADEVFFKNQPAYGATVRRDATALNVLYPPSEPQYIRLRIQDKVSAADIGWMLVLHTRMQNNKYFGGLHVGTLVTGFGDPANASDLIHAGVTYLTEQGVDLVVANWSHRSWTKASRSLGFLAGPSNFLFFTSPDSSPLLSADCPFEQMHLTRGDCDSPASLMAPKQKKAAADAEVSTAH